MPHLHQAIDDFLASSPYYRCLLLVHPGIARLCEEADRLERQYHWLRLSVGRELSAALLNVPEESRSRRAGEWTSGTVHTLGRGPVLCTGIDLLFEPALGLDPLALLRQASRATTLTVLWPGSYAHGILAYAVPEHVHYRTWSRPDVAVVGID